MTIPNPASFRSAASDREKRVRTRALLMDCAIAEFAAKGLAQTAVDDIVTRAKVSRGTFYYHFANMDEIMEAVGRAVAATFVSIVDQDIREVETGPERVALATQIFIEMASAIPDWGRLVSDALTNMGVFYAHISRGIRKDVLVGFRSGDFRIEPTDFLFSGLLAVVGAAVRARLQFPDDRTIAPQAAELVLLMLATPSETARTLPGEVMRKYSGKVWHNPDEIQKSLATIMPPLLNEMLDSQESSADART
ncbi:TetR/AcrR family transcriptional regulator [Pannonibacter phragmitetus]|uniref:HTH tetR-type domain-containing protein n=1 Tax=Pannonibacter phragmitetus TaxID=121719 RepID=A0A0U2W7R8_9HYPH|nr:TetR/AcrR family transcriptional regulator [Pannonibacter phragmitetus]ALV28506.1 hypothetical protein APZ00_16730 [Pannonibacter phragmitetus]